MKKVKEGAWGCNGKGWLSDEVTLEQRHEGKEGALSTSAGKVFLTEGTTYAEASEAGTK